MMMMNQPHSATSSSSSSTSSAPAESQDNSQQQQNQSPQLDDENAHVQELRRLFQSCCSEPPTGSHHRIDADGLVTLCEHLRLSAFAKHVIDRCLEGEFAVDFQTFKERFISLLPDVMEEQRQQASGSPAAAIDSLEGRAAETVRRLRLSKGGRLTRYEARIMCENTPGLDELSQIDVATLFERADYDQDGRVALDRFVAEYRALKRLSNEVQFIAENCAVGSFNFFEALDPGGTGRVEASDLLQFWARLGIRLDEGLAVLKLCGHEGEGSLNAAHLSAYLEKELSEAAWGLPATAKTAIIALHCYIDHLRCVAGEHERHATGIQRQLVAAQQRQTALAVELEQHEAAVEAACEERIREAEERCRARLAQLEEKARSERAELEADMEKLDDECARQRQTERQLANKLSLAERQAARLEDEARQAREAAVQLEQLNRQLRAELAKTAQQQAVVNAPDESNPSAASSVLVWKHRVELLVAHNKRLRDKVDELNRKCDGASAVQPLYTHNSNAFKNMLFALRRRAEALGDTLPERESEPDSIFCRVRRRRRLRRRERSARHARLAAARGPVPVDSDDQTPSTSSSRANVGRAVELERQKLQQEHAKEMGTLRQQAARLVQEQLQRQERQLQIAFEQQRRQWDIEMASEKNVLERRFAEEKMRMMERLQEDFESELRRVHLLMQQQQRPPGTGVVRQVDQLKAQVKALEQRLAVQQREAEQRIAAAQRKFSASTAADADFWQLFRSQKNEGGANVERSSRLSAGAGSPPMSAFSRTLSAVSTSGANSSPRRTCNKCPLVEARLKELWTQLAADSIPSASVTGGGATNVPLAPSESGFDERLSGADSVSQRSNSGSAKTEQRLALVRERVAELRALLAASSPTGSTRFIDTESNAMEKGKTPGVVTSPKTTQMRRTTSDLFACVDRLESEKVLLESRLSDAQLANKRLLAQFKEQQDECRRLASLASKS